MLGLREGSSQICQLPYESSRVFHPVYHCSTLLLDFCYCAEIQALLSPKILQVGSKEHISVYLCRGLWLKVTLSAIHHQVAQLLLRKQRRKQLLENEPEGKLRARKGKRPAHRDVCRGTQLFCGTRSIPGYLVSGRIGQSCYQHPQHLRPRLGLGLPIGFDLVAVQSCSVMVSDEC